jgi:ubiquinone/menaquinone biosynthesis C-methylase UbiE
MEDFETRQQVRKFYDQIGWQTVSAGMYQNARYEDLRLVSREYIHRCHLRVGRHLNPGGDYLLDAGSGPIQYPEYLTYSQGYKYRVCADISIQALKEARKRIGDHGLYVVSDVTFLPFKAGVFDGEVSLHTLHHLPLDDQPRAYDEIYRVLAHNRSAVVVNGWSQSPLMDRTRWLINLMDNAWSVYSRLRKKKPGMPSEPGEGLDDSSIHQSTGGNQPESKPEKPIGTYVKKMDAPALKKELTGKMPFEIRVWRSVDVHFLRAVIHPILGGRLWLRLLFWLEERFPHYLGEKGQYPLIIIRKGG